MKKYFDNYYDWWKNTDGDWEPINIDINDFSDFIYSNNIESTLYAIITPID